MLQSVKTVYLELGKRNRMRTNVTSKVHSISKGVNLEGNFFFDLIIDKFNYNISAIMVRDFY